MYLYTLFPKKDPRRKVLPYLIKVNAQIRENRKKKSREQNETNRIKRIERKERSKLLYDQRFTILQTTISQIQEIPKLPQSNHKRIRIQNVNLSDIQTDSQIDRAGCIIRTQHPDKNGFLYVLNRSNHNYLSDFGGGIRKCESWKDGFIRELTEECPWMKQEIVEYIEHSDSTQCLLDNTRGHHSRLLIVLTLPDCTSVNDWISKYHPVEEVKELVLLDSEQLCKAFTFTSGINYGILQLKRAFREGLIEI